MSEQGKSSTYLELVELAGGDIVLRHSNGEDDPMVLIRFSEESREWLGSSRLEVARHMVQAGIQAFNRINHSEPREQAAPARQSETSGTRITVGEEAPELEEEMPTVH